ncbi:12867_t:CDS:10 [Funneliformis caledonium]|uniref:12867_t:CDS:1 n=1 Tax=Funneliformis caledonium TaxID=1117310 RepID=A0A9N8ZTT7_9GLOM|nr:12867_t:CDS:10 [Funneliformis caledonium]
MTFVEFFKNDLLCTLATLGKDFNVQESIDYLVPTITKLITSTNDLETNKFVLTSLLFKIWQHQSSADQLDYNIFKVNYILSTDLYLELIKALNMENEIRKLLFSIPRLTVQKIVESLIYSNPSYGLRTVYDPALNVCNSLDDQHRSEFVSSLLQMMTEHEKIIKADDKLLFELLHSTAVHIKSYLDSNSTLNKKLDTPQNFENIQSNVEVDYLFSTSYYPDLISKSRQKRVDQMVKSKNQIVNTSKSFENLNTKPKRAFGDNKYLYQLLCLFDYLTLIACKGEQKNSQVNPSMKLIIRRVILQLKEADLTNVLSSLNKVYSNGNESINYLIEIINIEPHQRLSNLESRSERISRRLQKDKSEYQNASLNPQLSYDLNSNNEKNRELLTKHEEAFITICQSLRRNLDYNTSFANRIEDSDLNFKLGTLKEDLTKKDLTNYCHWVVNSIRFGQLGFVSLLKLMVQYIDLFNDLNIDEDIFSGLIVDYGFQRELYQSIKRLIKNRGETKNKIEIGMNLFLKAFSLLPRHTRCLFRDFMLSDRPSDTDFKSPTFDDWLIWPLEYDQRLTTLCNQIVFTAEKNSQENTDDKSQPIIKNKEDYIRSSDVDALIELSMIAPYFMLNRLISDCIHNKGEGLLIIDILREIGSVCWFRQTSKSPTLIIKVIQYKLSSLDKGLLRFNLQERKNLIDFLMLAMGKTAKSPMELTLFDIGEWSNNKLLLDIREYIKYCVMPYLDNSNLDGRNATLSLSLDILKVLLFPSVSTLPPANINWFIKSIPFSLLKSMASLFDQRKSMSVLIINNIDNIHVVLKELMKLCAGYISSLPDDYDQDNIHNSNAILIRQFYDKYRKFDWTTQLFLRSFFEICEDRLGIKIGKPIIPAMLLSFCDLSKEEFVVIDEDYESDSTKVKQMMTFLEGCRVSDGWCDKFISDLNRSQTITKPFLRNLFRTIAPLAFCHILANSSGEESSFLLNDLLKKLFFHGCLSAVELLTFDENDNELNESAIADLSFDERTSLCCLRFSFVNILTSLRLLKEQQKTFSNYEQHVSSQDIITDFRIIQNVIKVAKESFIVPNSTLSYLIVLFYTIAQAFPLLSFSFKAEESLYIFLLSIVNQIDNTRTIATHDKKSKTEIDIVDNGSSSNKKKFDQQLKQLELTQETDTVDSEASVKMYSEQKKKSADGPLIIEYSEWQERILIKGIKKVKNDNCGWRFTVADALGIRNDLIDHDS